MSTIDKVRAFYQQGGEENRLEQGRVEVRQADISLDLPCAVWTILRQFISG